MSISNPINHPTQPQAVVAQEPAVDLVQAEFSFLRNVSGFCRLIEERIVEREEIIKMLLNVPMTSWQIARNEEGAIYREYLSASHQEHGVINYEVALSARHDFNFEESDSRHYAYSGQISYHVNKSDKLAVFDLAPFPVLIEDCFATIKSKLGEAEYFDKQAAPLITEIKERLHNYGELLEIIKSLPLESALLIEKAPAPLNELAGKLVDSYDRHYCRVGCEGWFSLQDIHRVVKLTSGRYQAFLMSIEITFHDRHGNRDPEMSNLIVIFDKNNSNAKKIFFSFTEPYHEGIQKQLNRIWSKFKD